MKKYTLVVLLGFLFSGIVQSADDPMKSLFLFQQKMANNGSTAAMMKLGEMYEQGQGTAQDFDMAIKMYEKARNEGHSGAKSAIERVKRTRQEQIEAARRAKQRAAEQRRQAEEAKRRAEERRKAEREREAREQARREALAKKRAQEKARREAEARARAEEAAQARARAAAEARRKEQLARERKQREQAVVRANAEAAEANNKQEKTEQEDDGFKSDPCKGPAARVMSICK